MRIQESRPSGQTVAEKPYNPERKIWYRLPAQLPAISGSRNAVIIGIVNSLRARPGWMRGADVVWKQHAEYVAAAARLFFAAAAMVAIYIDPTEPSRYAQLAYVLLVGYVVFGAVVLGLVRKRRLAGPKFVFSVVAVDVAWATIISLFTQGPNSPFFLFFFFVLLSVAYRWGLRQTLVAAISFVGIIVVQAIVLTRGPVALLLRDEWEPNRMIMRAAYICILAFVMGYLAETERQLRGDLFAISELLQHVRMGTGFANTLAAITGELMRWFGAQGCLLVTDNAARHQAFLWQSRKGDSPRRWTELPRAELASYLLPIDGSGIAVGAVAGKGLALNADGSAGVAPSLTASFERFQSRNFVSVGFSLGDDWQARLFLLEPAAQSGGMRGLHFLLRLSPQLGPAVHNLYLSRAMRAQAGASERARIARELHDGVIQELAAISMEVEAARHHAEAPALGGELERIRGLLAEAVAHVRELMQQFRPVDIAPEQLPDFLADAVERFQRDTGISASFVSDVLAVPVPRWVCRELARIVQEGLVNVRRHSGARHVVVAMRVADDQLRIVIDDDGKGFDFRGELPLSELDARRKGPIVIKERARTIGADLLVTSEPQHGARLELRYPLSRKVAASA